VTLGNVRHRFGPRERRALALVEERRLAPGIERVEALLGFALGAGILGVHVETVSTAVDLGCASLDQVLQAGSQTGAAKVAFDRQQELHDLGIGVLKFDAGLHVDFSFVWLNGCYIDEAKCVRVTG